MTTHAFVDESQRGPYFVCAALIHPADLSSARTELRAMRLSGQRRLHFAKERPQRRRVLLKSMSRLPIRIRIYTSTDKEPVARTRAIQALLSDLIDLDGRRLVIERREASQDAREHRQIVAAIQAGKAPYELSYNHLASHEEPMLWVADAVAWAYGAGREWRPRVEPLIEQVRNLNSR